MVLCIHGIFLNLALSPSSYTPEYSPTKGPTVTFFLIDGVLQPRFESLLAKNKLKTSQKLIDGGLYIENGIGSFPTITGFAFYPFITGMDATNSGIYGLRWFDKSRIDGNHRNYVGKTNIEMNEDINSLYKNIFELAHPYYTASINSYMNKGVANSESTGWYHVTSKYNKVGIFRFLSWIPFIGNKIVYDHFDHEALVLDEALIQLERNPKVHWITFASPDALVHTDGLTEEYNQLLCHVDSLIGVYIDHAQGLQQQRYFVMISDHGVEAVTENSNIPVFLKEKYQLNIERGKSAHVMKKRLDKPVKKLKDLDGYFVINGNLAAYLYLNNKKQNNNWGEKLREQELRSFNSSNGQVDLIKAVLQDSSVEFAAYQIDHKPPKNFQNSF